MTKAAISLAKILTIFIVITGIVAGSNNLIYAKGVSVVGMTETQRRLTASIVASVSMNGEDATAQTLLTITIPSGVYTQDDWAIVLNACIGDGYFKDYVDDFENAGISVTSSGNTQNNKSTTEQNESKKSVKTEYTVEDIEPYTAWVTKNCNIRSGADTTYDKVGSLNKFEEVKVTGKASTGWYRITTSSGAEAYISNSLLTTDDPKKVTVQTSEESDEVVTTVEGEKPSAATQVVEEIKAEEASEEPKEEPKEEEPTYTSEITKEATCTEKGILTYTSENGDSYTEEIPMLEHVPGDWEVSKEPSLTKDGEKVKKCTVCGEILETQKIPAKTNVLIGIIIGCVIAIGGCIAGVVLYKKQKKD